MSEKTGQCLCGAVKLTAKNVPSTFNICYCDMCKRWAGGRWMGLHVPKGDLAVTGMDAVTTIVSSDWAERAFCNTCGSSLWYKLTEGPYADACSISVGLLDDTSDLTLKNEYYTDRKTCAYDFPKGRKQLTEAEVLALFAPTDAEEGEPE
ncbi:GFA family protein [uncultured Pelagimonas sp.]|uniref:GFA family protein n=1 Tax=uncultured Pelagimonas sp. TaxID=1618102 RepID=UPI00261C422A|nr:GFA family protein [uncultured Pelagimonas sp.]